MRDQPNPSPRGQRGGDRNAASPSRLGTSHRRFADCELCACAAPASRGRCSNSSPARAVRPVRRPTSCSASWPAIRRWSSSACRSITGTISAGRTRSPVPAHSARQRAYARVRGDREVYTPQIVVNGSTHVLGSDHAAIERAITQTDRNAAIMSVPVLLSVGGADLNVKVAAGKEHSAGEVWLCPLAKAMPVEIGRGENSGRTVTYHDVVRRWLKLGDWNGTDRNGTSRSPKSRTTAAMPPSSWCSKAPATSRASSSAPPIAPISTAHHRRQMTEE